MQPDNPGRQKLAQLPQAALEALLDSDDLKVASENSAIAAVTFWLEQEDRAGQLTKEQKQRLAYKLRLLRATPWYLTHALSDEDHWMSSVLTAGQRVMLAAAVQKLEDYNRLDPEGPGMKAKLFGKEKAPLVSWSRQRRGESPISEGKVLVEASVGEVWEKRNKQSITGPNYFYSGMLWALQVQIVTVEEAPTAFRMGAYVVLKAYNQPVGFSAQFELVGSSKQDTKMLRFDGHLMCKPWDHCGFRNIFGGNFTSLEDATTKLIPFIHPDGKLHFRAAVKDVQ